MTKSQSVLDLARHDAQELHKKIAANMAKAEQASWADVKAIQTDINALGVKMKSLADDQADSAQAAIKAAITKLERAGKLVENKAVAAKDGVSNANAEMLESAHRATTSLSAAVAAARSKLAHAIEPKKVST